MIMRIVAFQVTLESLLATEFIAFRIYSGIEANKHKQRGKAFAWSATVPLLRMLAFASFLILILIFSLAAIVAICFGVLAALSSSLDHGMIRHLIDRVEIPSDVQSGVTRAVGGANFPVRSASGGHGGWNGRAQIRSDVETAVMVVGIGVRTVITARSDLR